MQAYSITQTHSNVAFGYLAVLLGTLCLNAQIRTRVSCHLPGGSLWSLSDAVREFLSYHRKVDAQLGIGSEREGGKEGEMGEKGLTERLEGMVRRLERAVG